MDVANQFDVFLVALDPTLGSEIKKTRPCVIISPDEMNLFLHTVIIAPLTSTKKNYPTRVNTRFEGKNGQVVLDQIRTVDKKRLVKKLGTASTSAQNQILSVLQEMFAQ